MKVKDLQIGDTINGMIVYDNIQPRYGVSGQIEVPIVMPIPMNTQTLGTIEFQGKFYNVMHPYTFGEDGQLPHP